MVEGVAGGQILAYYDETGHKDWTHAETGAPARKAQHPEFEMWNQGIRARPASPARTATCYTRVGALKISDHHVRSPLLNIARACQTLPPLPEQELLARAETLQARVHGLRNIGLDALVELIADLKASREAGLPDQEMAKARDFQRKAQFYLDFVRRRTPRASTPPKRPSASWPSRSTSPGKASSSCAS